MARQHMTVPQLAELACLMEVACPKPGNVSPGKPFRYINEMTFAASAICASEAFLDPDASVGAMVLEGVQATQETVERNTNLGILLLLAPLVKTAHGGSLSREDVARTLSELTAQDAADVYRAIRTAAPEGLGRSETYDIADGAPPSLMDAMQAAAPWDSVAREYAKCYEITFGATLPCLSRLWQEGRTLKSSLQQTALTLLSLFPDTLIARKLGLPIAMEVAADAKRALAVGGYYRREGRQIVLDLAMRLDDMDNRMNPGTTADLVAAGLFVFLYEEQRRTPLPDIIERWDAKIIC